MLYKPRTHIYETRTQAVLATHTCFMSREDRLHKQRTKAVQAAHTGCMSSLHSLLKQQNTQTV
jgi:hypothetical protein